MYQVVSKKVDYVTNLSGDKLIKNKNLNTVSVQSTSSVNSWWNPLSAIRGQYLSDFYSSFDKDFILLDGWSAFCIHRVRHVATALLFVASRHNSEADQRKM